MESAAARRPKLTESIQAKLLVLLIVLSLPLLILSLIQLQNYNHNLAEQTATIVRIETNAVTQALQSWLENYQREAIAPSTQADSPLGITEAATIDLYRNLSGALSSDDKPVVAAFDQHGLVLAPPTGMPSLEASDLSLGVQQRTWTDNVPRITSVQRLDEFGWSVAVGIPVIKDTPAGRSALWLMATWALALLASTLLAVWATNRFTTPLRGLAEAVSTFGDGQLQERVRVETVDEVGTLAKSFNTMATRLEAKFAELQAQRYFTEEALDSLPLAVVVLDHRLTVRKVNKTFARCVNSNAAQLVGRGVYEAAAGLAALRDVIEDVRRTRTPFVTYGLPLEFVAEHAAGKDSPEAGEKFWDVTIWPTTKQSAEGGDILLILAEVSKRVRAEKLATDAFAAERARASELASVINGMNEGVAIVDARGRYRVNPMATKIIGRKPAELRDGVQALIDDLHLHDLSNRKLKPLETPLGRALEAGEQVSGERLKVVRDDGGESVVAVSATPLANENGRREGAVAIFHDITEEMRRHDELVEAYRRLREHDRLKSAFVASMSHELRTPLNVITGLCQWLMRDRQQPLASAHQEAIARVQRNARSLLEHVNHLLDYSRLEAGTAALHLEEVDVAEVVRATIEAHALEAAEKKIELRLNVKEDLGLIVTDRNKLSQVVSNLVGNAVKFTFEGSVTVTTGGFDDERWYVEVSDTGIGMTDEALKFIFDEFRQVDERLARRYGGVGLGLAITRKIVELLEGVITVESKPNEGSRFRIAWPRITRLRTGTGSLVKDGEPSRIVTNVMNATNVTNTTNGTSATNAAPHLHSSRAR